jgi:hypothetical protein
MASAMKTVRCFGCGGEYPDVDGPTHRYMASTPGCWAIYGDILAREFNSPVEYFGVHRLTVDAYAVQHPGLNDRQSIQSVGFHLIRLCLFLEHGLTAEKANEAMLEAAGRKHEFFRLDPPASMGPITAADVHRAKSGSEHQAIVSEWAHYSWQAWADHHGTVRSWLPAGYRD